MELKNFFIQDDQGNKLPGAQCYLYQRGTESPAIGAVKANGDPLSSPFAAGNDGLIQLAAPNGLYDLRVTGNGRDYRIRLQFNDVSESVESARAAALQAVDARDAALLLAGIYVSTAVGLLNTIDGECFGVPSPVSREYLILYANSAGVAVDTGKRSPSEGAIFSQNIWYDPFGETLAARPLLGFGTRACYSGTLNVVSVNTPYPGKPTLSAAIGNVQRSAPLAQLGRAVGDTVRFAVDVQTALAGPILSIFFRDAGSAVLSTHNTPATSSTPPAGRNILQSSELVIPVGTSYIEIRVTGAGGAVELFAVACGAGFSPPKIAYSPTPVKYDGLATTQKNLWPDPFLRQHQAGIKYHDGWGFAQVAGVAIPGVVTKSSNSPFPDKNVILLPTGAGQHDMNIDARRLGLRLGSRVTFVLAVYAAQNINVAIFGRNAAGAVVGDSSAVDYLWANGAALYEIRKTVVVDQLMLDTVKFFQVRLLNGRTVGVVPVEICARGCFVSDTDPLLFDDCYADDVQAIERARRPAFGESTLRETQKRLTAITFGSVITNQFKSAHIGDSYTHLPARWIQPFVTHMQGKYGDGGPGWIGFGNPDAGSGNINGQNWQGLSVTVTGTWTSAYATAPGPDICSVSSANVATQYRVNNLPAGLSALQLYALTSAAILEYTTDGGATWIEVDLSVGSGATVANLTIPATSFNLWMRPKTGTCTLYGIDAQKANGHRVHKLGATGSSAAQWATQTATATWKASMTALDPNLVSIMLATNDQTGSTAPWALGGYIETIIANVRLALPLADIAVLMPAENQRSNNVKMAAYASVVRELCARLNVAFCDLQQDYGLDPADYASTSARNWYSPDLIHPNPATDGGLPIAARMVKLLKNGL
ncbi:SGNH/GDSL hydrolase family protein [Pseudomonas helleri]|uniref:SGNH/GDSL hydrolase family protein n=1 Tax=Pseudomonas helleri TaxID=1608996 RepID=UPI003FD5ABEA